MDSVTLTMYIRQYMAWRLEYPLLAAEQDYFHGIHSELLGFAEWLENYI